MGVPYRVPLPGVLEIWREIQNSELYPLGKHDVQIPILRGFGKGTWLLCGAGTWL